MITTDVKTKRVIRNGKLVTQLTWYKNNSLEKVEYVDDIELFD